MSYFKNPSCQHPFAFFCVHKTKLHTRNNNFETTTPHHTVVKMMKITTNDDKVIYVNEDTQQQPLLNTNPRTNMCRYVYAMQNLPPTQRLGVLYFALIKADQRVAARTKSRALISLCKLIKERNDGFRQQMKLMVDWCSKNKKNMFIMMPPKVRVSSNWKDLLMTTYALLQNTHKRRTITESIVGIMEYEAYGFYSGQWIRYGEERIQAQVKSVEQVEQVKAMKSSRSSRSASSAQYHDDQHQNVCNYISAYPPKWHDTYNNLSDTLNRMVSIERTKIVD